MNHAEICVSQSKTGSELLTTPRATKNDNELIWEYLPADHSHQSSSLKEAREVLRAFDHPVFLDLGCGTGSSYDKVAIRPMEWIGLDIAESQEVNQRRRTDLRFLTYDGIHVPLDASSVDIVYSHQVFEHVRYPQELLKDVRRVLRPSGCLVGSTSHLEPYHSRSLWNYTVYGFSELLREAGFSSLEFRPGIDGLTLITRRLLGLARMGSILNPFFEFQSPLNVILETLRLCGVGTKRRNALKLLFSGHFTFVARL